MAYVFFPSCKVKTQFADSSEKAAAYLKKRFGIEPEGCCRPGHKKLTSDDTAIVVCNNCAAVIEESSDAGNLTYLWEIIDADPEFEFPDYHGEKMTVQDCWVAKERKEMQDTVRSLLQKMNIEIVEQEENYDKTRFSGLTLLNPCNPDNAKLAPRRYVQEGAHMFTPMSSEEQKIYLRKHCAKITTDKAVCYCKFCVDGINIGGKEGVHLLDLLFPGEKK